MLRCATCALCYAWCARLQVPDTAFWVLGVLMSLKVVSDIAERLNETKLGVQKLVEKQVVVCGVFWAACKRGGLIAFGRGRVDSFGAESSGGQLSFSIRVLLGVDPTLPTVDSFTAYLTFDSCATYPIHPSLFRRLFPTPDFGSLPPTPPTFDFFS